MNWLIDSLRQYPELVVILTVGIGYWIGNYRIGNFTLGTVTASLIVGLVVGNLHIEPSRDLRWAFFLLFLFGNGYSVGPQFFQALKSDGIKPMLLSVVVCGTGLITACVLARILHLDVGMAAGLFSGGMTQSAAMGTASEAIASLPISDVDKKLFVSHVAIVDALCYVFGAIGIIWFCGTIAPWLLRIDLKKEAKALEAKLGIKNDAVGIYSANEMFAVRAYRIKPNAKIIDRKVWDVESHVPGASVFIARIVRGGKIMDAASDQMIRRGDSLVLYGHTDTVVDFGSTNGSEIVDRKILDFPMEVLKVVVTNKYFTTRELSDLRNMPELRSVTARSMMRGGEAILAGASTKLLPGDVIELVGPQSAVERAAKMMGYALRPTSTTPLSIVCLGIFVGGLMGLPYLMISGFKLSLTVSVGVLLAGLCAGWLRTKRPLLPNVPDAAIQLMITLGLAVFVASTGIQAGPHFIDAFKTFGLPLLLSGAAVTLIPMLVGLFFGKWFLKMNPIILLGAVSGAQTYTGGMATVQEKSGSRVAILGYTVPYATSNILLTLFGALMVSILS